MSFAKAWGWGVLDGASQFETCTTTCQTGVAGGGAGQLYTPQGVAVDGSGDVFVADFHENRIDEFSSAGAFIKAWGWGVLDGGSQLETCTTSCRAGLAGGGAGELVQPQGIAVDGSGDVVVADTYNHRIDEFSSAGAFIEAWGWGVADGAGHFETCTATCQAGISGGGAGQVDLPEGVAVDGSGDVLVADTYAQRIDEFSASGTFTRAWGWGVADGAGQFETCIATCESGFAGGGAGELDYPVSIAADGAGDVFVGGYYSDRIDEFSSAGAFVKAWGWGVLDGAGQLETCSDTCRAALSGGGAGELADPQGVAVDGSGDVFVADFYDARVDEFSSAGVFIEAWGWGVLDGKTQFEICTTTCRSGLGGSNAGQLDEPFGIAVDGSGDVFVADNLDPRVDEFGAASLAQDTLTVSLAGAGSGSVTSTPAGIDCGATCSAEFDASSQVTLTAAPAAGSSFSGWSGGGCSGTGTCTVTMSSDQAVTAAFTLLSAMLSVTKSGSGSGTVSSSPAGIDCGSTCSHAYPAGTSVTLMATAATGSTFSGWSGACAGTGNCTVSMTAARSVSAIFTRKAAKVCVVPRVKGETLAAAKKAIRRAGCSVGKVRRVVSKVEKSRVISQKPRARTRLGYGAKVNLVVSRGRKR